MGVLIEVDELAAVLNGEPRPAVIDVRWSLGGPSRLPDYLAGHIPGARWVDLETELSDQRRAGGR
ncbi:MAG: sulfurtransferase, partial [Microlunatus sp.]|nr:sulfurtransferase [Microlunatus sp.]